MQGDFLRFLTCGSVDDGKSTLIGRLLYDAGLVCEDHLAGIVRDGEPDCSLLLDGLLAEREQGITIDVAYRHFATAKRRFMVADSPGHEEYTPNMVTAASHADVAILLIDASRGLLVQTRRHAAIARLMGISTVLLAVNKMDLVHFDEQAYRQIEAAFGNLAAELGIAHAQCMPLCARAGDNVVHSSTSMPWYAGPTLLHWLENAQPKTNDGQLPMRMAVQLANRPDDSFRGVSGTLSCGSVAKGDTLLVLDSGQQSRVSRIITPEGEAEKALAGTAVTLAFEDELDISRGSFLVAANAPKPRLADRLEADLVWLAKTPLQCGRPYLFKRGPLERHASISRVEGRLNLFTFGEEAAGTLGVNELGRVQLECVPPLPFEPYDTSRGLGHGILIDRVSGATVGALLLRKALNVHNLTWHHFSVSDADRARLMGQRPCVLWFTGLSGAGKSTVADHVERRLFEMGRHCYVLDGDNVRHGLNRDLGFSARDREENIRRVAEVAKLMMQAGLMVIVTFISPFENDRRMARSIFPAGRFFEIFVDTPLETCIRRDSKGLYKKALAGEIAEMTGISSPYERPSNPDLHLDGDGTSPEQMAQAVLELLEAAKGHDGAKG